MKNLNWRTNLLTGLALSLAFSLLYAEDTVKRTAPPPPHKAATTTAPRTASTGAPRTAPTTGGASQMDPNHGAVTGRRVYTPSTVAPTHNGTTPTGVPTAPTRTQQPNYRRAPINNPPNVPQTQPGTGTRPVTGSANTPYDANHGSYTGRRAHQPVTVQVHTWQGKGGATAQIGSDGHLHQVSTRGMTILHPPGGGRQIVAVRPDHTRIVTNGAGHGYVQAPFSFRGHEYARRTYYYQGHPYVNYYRSYSYHNVALVEYTPVRYYSPVFYGWAYHPWARPVYYGGWGWNGSPWYGYYGGYFQPYQSYPSAAFWLTDFVIAASLQAAYQQQMDAQGAPPQPYDSGDGGNVTLTPQVKQQIADEVQRQLALENSEGQQASQNIEPDPDSSGLPRTLSDGASHVFVVADPINVSDSTGQSCVVSDGDVLQLQSPPPQNASAGFLYVLASKDQDCPLGDVVTVAFSDLQDMQNQMRASIDNGLGQLQNQAGQGGLPGAPQGASVPPVQSAFAPIAPPPDPNVANELNQQAGDAGQAEQQVMSESGAGGQ